MGDSSVQNVQLIRTGCTRPVCLACCSMEASPGPWMPTKNAGSTPSTCTTRGGFWGSLGKTAPPARMSWLRQQYQTCLPCCYKGASAGLAMSATCRTDRPPRICYMVSLQLAPDLQEGLCFAIKMSAKET